MNINNRLTKLEKSQNIGVCNCLGKSRNAYSVEEFEAKCKECGKDVEWATLFVENLSDAAHITRNVKIYSGFDPDMM